jgi:hypothetical protein
MLPPAMHEHMSTSDTDFPLSITGAEPSDAADSSVARDVRWVFARLDDPRVQQTDAPSRGAWNMVQWARSERSRFYEQVLPKALSAKAVAHLSTEASEAFDDVSEEIDLERAIHRAHADHVTPRVLEDVEALVDWWALEHEIVLDSEHRELLSCQLAGDVGRCVEAVVYDRKLFRDWAPPTP